MKVLVVEDDKKIAAAVKRGLEQEGFAGTVAFDGMRTPYEVGSKKPVHKGESAL